MSPIRLGIAPGPIEQVPAEVAVVSFFDDERPLRGDAGRADWRLCGALSRLVRSGKLRGDFGEAALVPTSGGLRARWVLALGLGRRDAFDAARRSQIAEQGLDRALALQAQQVALSLPPAGPVDPGSEARLALLLEVLERAALRVPHPVQVRLLLSAAEHAALSATLRDRARSRGRPGVSIEWIPPVERPRGQSPAGTTDAGRVQRSEAELRVK